MTRYLRSCRTCPTGNATASGVPLCPDCREEAGEALIARLSRAERGIRGHLSNSPEMIEYANAWRAIRQRLGLPVGEEE